MAVVSHTAGEVIFKIAYCGPSRGGKATNLRYLHGRLDSRWRGDMVSATAGESSIHSFEYLPILPAELSGYRARFQLFTVPGGELSREKRISILAGVDAVVFVADSSPDRLAANVGALRETEDCLRALGTDPREIPLVFQFNKRDLRGAVSPEILDEALFVRTPTFLSSATAGFQVFGTLDRATQLILQGFRASNVAGLSAVHPGDIPAGAAQAGPAPRNPRMGTVRCDT